MNNIDSLKNIRIVKMGKQTIEELEAQVKQLAAENASQAITIKELATLNNRLLQWTSRMSYNASYVGEPEGMVKGHIREMGWILGASAKTPATDAILASLRAEARKQGAVFAANRMLAAWDAGFVEDTPENAADIARAILMSTEFMDEAPDGDFDRSFADEVLEAIAAQLRSKSEVQS